MKRLSAPYADYAVSPDGKILSFKRSEKGSPVATKTDKDGYLQVNLSNNAENHGFKVFRVHDLVARAFLGARPEGAEVLHKDGSRTNNAASNLKYGSRSENATQRESDKRADSVDVDDLPTAEPSLLDILEAHFAQLRTDSADCDDYIRLDSTFEIGHWERTPEGYLKATAIVAREDTLHYPEEGRSEFVSEEALETGAASLLYKPVTMEHPLRGEVDETDWKQFAVGVVVESRYDSELRAIVAGIVVYDKKAIDAVLKDDIREVSPGYRAAVVADPTYGFRQVRRASNHLAITRKGRGGPEASIRLDSKGQPANHEEQMDEEEKKKADALQEKLDAMEKERDGLKAKVDAFEAMAKKKGEEEDEKKNDSDFVRLFNERNQALSMAKRVDAVINDQMTNEQLMAAIVSKATGNDLRTDSTDALRGAYEVVCQMVPEKNSPAHLGAVFSQNLATGSELKNDAADDMFAIYDNDAAVAAGQFQFNQE